MGTNQQPSAVSPQALDHKAVSVLYGLCGPLLLRRRQLPLALQ